VPHRAITNEGLTGCGKTQYPRQAVFGRVSERVPQ
jgi:hypothetical protein